MPHFATICTNPAPLHHPPKTRRLLRFFFLIFGFYDFFEEQRHQKEELLNKKAKRCFWRWIWSCSRADLRREMVGGWGFFYSFGNYGVVRVLCWWFCVGGFVVWVVVYFGCKCLGFWNFTGENLVLPSCWCQQNGKFGQDVGVGSEILVWCRKWGKIFKRYFFIYFNIFFLSLWAVFLSLACRLRFGGGFSVFWLKVWVVLWWFGCIDDDVMACERVHLWECCSVHLLEWGRVGLWRCELFVVTGAWGCGDFSGLVSLGFGGRGNPQAPALSQLPMRELPYDYSK